MFQIMRTGSQNEMFSRSYLFCIGLVLAIALAGTFAQSAFAQSKCDCWINSKTGQAVPDLPFGADRNDIDPNRAFVPATGNNYVRDQDCTWINSKTGQAVPGLPFGADRNDIDPSRAFVPATGNNYYRLVPCPLKTKIERTAAGLKLTFDGTLQSADNAAGPYTDKAGAKSPAEVPLPVMPKFYRTKMTFGTFIILDPNLSRAYVASVSMGGLDGIFNNGTFLRMQETCSPSFFFSNFVGSLQVSGTGTGTVPGSGAVTGIWKGNIGDTPSSGELALTFNQSTVQITERIVLETRNCFGEFTASLTRPGPTVVPPGPTSIVVSDIYGSVDIFGWNLQAEFTTLTPGTGYTVTSTLFGPNTKFNSFSGSPEVSTFEDAGDITLMKGGTTLAADHFMPMSSYYDGGFGPMPLYLPGDGLHYTWTGGLNITAGSADVIAPTPVTVLSPLATPVGQKMDVDTTKAVVFTFQGTCAGTISVNFYGGDGLTSVVAEYDTMKPGTYSIPAEAMAGLGKGTGSFFITQSSATEVMAGTRKVTVRAKVSAKQADGSDYPDTVLATIR
jgi:hypothetical protein